MSKSHLPNLMHLRETHFCSNLAFINPQCNKLEFVSHRIAGSPHASMYAK